MAGYGSKMLEYGLYLLVFLLPLQTRYILKAGEIDGNYSEYLTYSIYATDLLLIGLLILKALVLRSDGFSALGVLKSRKFLMFFTILAVLLLSAQDRGLAAFGVFRIFLGFGLFSLVISAPRPHKILAAFLASLFLQSAIGIYQFVLQESFVNKWLGMAFHAPFNPGSPVIETMDGRWLRAYGSLDHPNILGVCLAVGLMFIVLSAIRHEKKDYIQMIFLSALAPILSISLAFTFSRSAIVGLTAFYCLFIVLIYFCDKSRIKYIIVPIIASLAAMGLIFILFQDVALNRLHGGSRLEQRSLKERRGQYGDSLELIKRNMFFGVGVNNYVHALKRNAPDQVDYFQPVHNTFLLVVSEIGVLGFILFLFYFFTTKYWKIFNNKQCLLLPVLLSFCVFFFLDHWFWSLHYGILFISLSFGIFINLINYQSSNLKL